MKVFFDTEFSEEFAESGRAEYIIVPISIGLVREDGEELYLQWEEWEGVQDRETWIGQHVLPLLDRTSFASLDTIRTRVKQFAGVEPEWWGYYCDYDWVLLCQLYGGMMRLPSGWPMFCHDLKQHIVTFGIEPPEQTGVEHHALADARWIKSAWEDVEHRRP